jgi:hypothetical protein
MANKTIRTTGQLREFLVSMIIGVKDGDLDLEKARNITKLAAQVNESFYSEVKIAKCAVELGGVASELGMLPINLEVKESK